MQKDLFDEACQIFEPNHNSLSTLVGLDRHILF
jgi:hypothetical protein